MDLALELEKLRKKLSALKIEQERQAKVLRARQYEPGCAGGGAFQEVWSASAWSPAVRRPDFRWIR